MLSLSQHKFCLSPGGFATAMSQVHHSRSRRTCLSRGKRRDSFVSLTIGGNSEPFSEA